MWIFIQECIIFIMSVHYWIRKCLRSLDWFRSCSQKYFFSRKHSFGLFIYFLSQNLSSSRGMHLIMSVITQVLIRHRVQSLGINKRLITLSRLIQLFKILTNLRLFYASIKRRSWLIQKAQAFSSSFQFWWTCLRCYSNFIDFCKSSHIPNAFSVFFSEVNRTHDRPFYFSKFLNFRWLRRLNRRSKYTVCFICRSV